MNKDIESEAMPNMPVKQQLSLSVITSTSEVFK